MKVPGLRCKGLIRSSLLTSGVLLLSAGQASAAGGLISVDGSLFIQIANFLLLVWILNIILYKPIRKILLERKDKIAGLEQGIESAIQDAQDKGDEFAKGIRHARSEGIQKKDALVGEATAEERAIVGKINEQAQADMAEVKKKIAEEAEQVRASLEQQVDEFANAIGQKILGRAV